jgi:hypothetical protein
MQVGTVSISVTELCRIVPSTMLFAHSVPLSPITYLTCYQCPLSVRLPHAPAKSEKCEQKREERTHPLQETEGAKGRPPIDARRVT